MLTLLAARVKPAVAIFNKADLVCAADVFVCVADGFPVNGIIGQGIEVFVFLPPPFQMDGTHHNLLDPIPVVASDPFAVYDEHRAATRIWLFVICLAVEPFATRGFVHFGVELRNIGEG